MDSSSLIGIKYYSHGAMFMHAVEVLSKEPAFVTRGSTFSSPVTTYLASHAIELYLKAALLKRAVPAKELRSPNVRHDLVALAGKLMQHRKISASTLEVVNILAPQHKDHSIRYDGEGTIVNLERLQSAMLELLNLCAVSGDKHDA